MIKILLLEDEIKLNQSVCRFLQNNGYQVTGCLDADDALECLSNQMFDVILSDVMLPGMDGFEFAAYVRKINEQIPILFLTALDDLGSKKKGYLAGIDDYMVKPIEFDELLMRIQALLRRANIMNKNRLTIGKLILDSDEMTAYLDGEEISLTVREFHVLYKLLSYPKRTFTRLQLMDEFWGYDSDADPRTVDVYITRLRSKFKDCDDFKIVTVHGLGYKAVL
ncbi:MAG: response regulator transcription factor [Lachnospiraceae bacterium]|nr:response regulator transcription factor [Lachnospiraceae bacterium]